MNLVNWMSRMDLASASKILLASPLALIVLTLGLSSTGCSTGQANPAKIKTEFVDRDMSGDTIYLESVPADTRRVDWKNYEIREKSEALVGEPIIAVRNYTAGDRVVRSVALRDFVQNCKKGSGAAPPTPEEAEKLACSSKPFNAMRGTAERAYKVAGAFEEDGRTYFLSTIDTPDGTLFFATDREGRLKRDRYLAWRMAGKSSVVTQFGIPLQALNTKVNLDREEPLVRYETEEYIVPESSDYVHYELLFAGTTYDHRGMVYHFLYKEFRRGGRQIPIYTKQLEYTSRKTTIDLLGRRIRIYGVDDDRIVYAVQMD
jgi:hypothetical protein